MRQKQYQQIQQQMHQKQMQQQQQMQRPPPPHKYSPQYAAYVGAKTRAQSSARIGLGGAF